jgi:hypothetical protein
LVLVSSTAFAIGVLFADRVTTWAIGAVIMLLAVLVSRRRSSGELIGVLLVYVVPIAFTIGLWTLIVLRASETIPGWLGGTANGAGIATSTSDFALLITPLVLAVAVALAVHVPPAAGHRRPRRRALPADPAVHRRPAPRGLARAYAEGSLQVVAQQ